MGFFSVLKTATPPMTDKDLLPIKTFEIKNV
jgi:hypothetical protein